ncbi:MAG TPA: ATP-binding protein [Ktedonobacteraceae bacterium]|nr:ATP-binding protein [Ktedonobacteraceae bacterium]
MSDETLSNSNQQTQEHLRAALRESEILRELGELLASSLDLNHILQVLVKRSAEVCEVERCTVWLLEEKSHVLRPATYHLSSQNISSNAIQAADAIWYRSTLSFQDPVIQQLFKEKGILYIADLHTIATLRPVAETFLVRSVLLIALVRQGRPLGMLTLDNPDKASTFSAQQQQLAHAIGQQAAIAIDNARLYQHAEEERRRTEHLIDRARAISQVALTVNSGEELSTALEVATRYLVTGLNADGGAIVLLDENLQLASEVNLQQHGKNTPAPILVHLPHCRLVATTGVPLLVKKEQLEGEEASWFGQLCLENTLIVPLMVGTKSRQEMNAPEASIADARCVGLAFVTFHDCNTHPSRGQLAFAQDIAAQCALAIEKARLLAKAHQAAELATERANTLDAVFQAMNEGITVIDREGLVLVSNNAASKFLGVPLNTKEPLTTWLRRFPVYTLHGQPVSEEDFPVSRALRGERIRGERFVTTRSDGAERVVEVNITPLLDSSKQQTALVCAFRDVTQQMRIERRIRHALETMLHVAEAVSGITDIKEILNSVLSMTMKVLNCDRGMIQLYDHEKHAFTPLLSIGFTKAAEKQWLIDQNAWLNPAPDDYHGFQTQLMEGHATLVSADQFEMHSDQRDHLSNVMILAAPIIHSNRLHGLILLDRSQSLANDVAQAESRQPDTRHQEFSVWDMAILEGIVQLAGLAVEQARWQQEAQNAQTREAAMREANMLKDEFLAITAHEFRTPLTVILAHSQMALRTLRKAASQEQISDDLSSYFNENLATIEEQTHQLTNIVNTFLEVTQINRGQLALKLEEVDVAALAQQVVNDHSATSSNHTLTCTVEEAEHPYIVQGDSARLQQILANLVQNAIKYSPLGGPITVSLRQITSSQGKPFIEVCVEDKGIGIPKEAQARLFERFYRAPNIQGSKTRGIGLGLYIVAQLLRLHGGTIRVESSGNFGEGSRFIFTLPLQIL